MDVASEGQATDQGLVLATSIVGRRAGRRRLYVRSGKTWRKVLKTDVGRGHLPQHRLGEERRVQGDGPERLQRQYGLPHPRRAGAGGEGEVRFSGLEAVVRRSST